MFFGKPFLTNLQLEVDNLKQQLEQQAAKHRDEVARLNALITDKANAADVYFDFNNMKVFSVERNMNNGVPCTIIGYLLKEPVLSSDGEMIVEKDVIREWYLYCNDARHQELVKSFKESVK